MTFALDRPELESQDLPATYPSHTDIMLCFESTATCTLKPTSVLPFLYIERLSGSVSEKEEGHPLFLFAQLVAVVNSLN